AEKKGHHDEFGGNRAPDGPDPLSGDRARVGGRDSRANSRHEHSSELSSELSTKHPPGSVRTAAAGCATDLVTRICGAGNPGISPDPAAFHGDVAHSGRRGRFR